MSEKVKVVVTAPWALILFLIFMTLKLCGVITWSWWWVTAPLWGVLVFIAITFGALALLALIAYFASR